MSFPLGLKNYHELRATTLIPRLLVVLVLPKNPAEWLETSECPSRNDENDEDRQRALDSIGCDFVNWADCRRSPSKLQQVARLRGCQS